MGTRVAGSPAPRTRHLPTVAQQVVTWSREQSSLVGRGPPLPSPQGQTLPHGGDNLLTLLLQLKLSPEQGPEQSFLPRWIRKQLGAVCAVSGWQTPSHRPLLLLLRRLSPSAHATLRCQWSGPSSPAAPCSTGSIAARNELARALRRTQQSTRARLAAYLLPPPSAPPGASFPSAPRGRTGLL